MTNIIIFMIFANVFNPRSLIIYNQFYNLIFIRSFFFYSCPRF